MNYIGFWKRVLASLIDWLVMLIPGMIVGAIIGAIAPLILLTSRSETAAIGASFGIAILSNIVMTLLYWLYYACMESSTLQGTVGKLALGIKVVDLNGDKITFTRATGRYFSKIVSGLILCIGYIMVAFTDKKQGLHDIMAGTLVIKK